MNTLNSRKMPQSAQSAKLPAGAASFIRGSGETLLLAVETKCSDSNANVRLPCFSFLSGGESGEKRSVHRSKPVEEEKEKRAAHKHQEKREDETHQRWSRRGKSTPVKTEAPHHSKEAFEEEEMEGRRAQTSPEEKELQMIAGRRHEEKRGSEEEGSASRKSEVCSFLSSQHGSLLISLSAFKSE